MISTRFSVSLTCQIDACLCQIVYCARYNAQYHSHVHFEPSFFTPTPRHAHFQPRAHAFRAYCEHLMVGAACFGGAKPHIIHQSVSDRRTIVLCLALVSLSMLITLMTWQLLYQQHRTFSSECQAFACIGPR